jgi:Anti-sigma factor NepR
MPETRKLGAAGGKSRVGSDERRGPSRMDPQVAQALGNALRAHYQSIAEAPLPDRFLVLLAELEAKERDDAK